MEDISLTSNSKKLSLTPYDGYLQLLPVHRAQTVVKDLVATAAQFD